MMEKKTLQVSQTENFFDELADGWSGRYVNDPQMTMRIQRFMDVLTDIPSGAKILDFGCGSGVIANHFASTGYEVSAVDVSMQMLKQGEEADELKAVTWKQYSGAGETGFSNESFDAIISSSVFEYLDNPKGILNELFRIMKPNGVLAFTVPDMRDRHRKKETLIKVLSNLPVLSTILKKTRWAEGMKYLALSNSRFDLCEWDKICSTAGFTLSAVKKSNGPLVMLVARKQLL